LTREGIEPNSSSIEWEEIEVTLKNKFGSFFSDAYKMMLDEFRDKIIFYCIFTLLDFLEDKWVTKYFSDPANQKYPF
jgi:hypothetical protein